MWIIVNSWQFWIHQIFCQHKYQTFEQSFPILIGQMCCPIMEADAHAFVGHITNTCIQITMASCILAAIAGKGSGTFAFHKVFLLKSGNIQHTYNTSHQAKQLYIHHGRPLRSICHCNQHDQQQQICWDSHMPPSSQWASPSTIQFVSDRVLCETSNLYQPVHNNHWPWE